MHGPSGTGRTESRFGVPSGAPLLMLLMTRKSLTPVGSPCFVEVPAGTALLSMQIIGASGCPQLLIPNEVSNPSSRGGADQSSCLDGAPASCGCLFGIA